MPVTVTKSGPGLAAITASLKRLEKSDVLIGIPASGALRKGDEMNNASLAFIQENGSEIANIPPRPFLQPSIDANKAIIAPHLAKAAQSILKRNPEKADFELQLAGVIASNGAKRWFTDPRNGWAPNAPSTIATKGSDRPLIDTGLLRRSLTYVIREDGNEKVVASSSSEGQPIEAAAEPKISAGESLGAEIEAGIGEAAETIGGGLLP